MSTKYFKIIRRGGCKHQKWSTGSCLTKNHETEKDLPKTIISLTSGNKKLIKRAHTRLNANESKINQTEIITSHSSDGWHKIEN